ncbi:Proprotein convertase, P [uncultured Caudovirales phage]|uniref:Proprotein convertase, P n=1 Tax=uncultured Caudovirales phage TaxID=2100421 RepID=A0A6J7WET4_9CAUD|nr:Proprotein convertase, P [uncultured Caudovirales phage]
MITVESAPAYLNPVKNPIRYVLTSDNQTKCGFKFVGSLYIQKQPWIASAFEKVIEVRKYPLQSTDNKGVFDFSNILEDFVKIQYDLLTGTPLINRSLSYLRYYVVFEEEYEDLCDGVPNKYNPNTTSQLVVFNGRVDFNSYKKFSTYSFANYQNQFLSNSPIWRRLSDGINYPLPVEDYTHTIRPNDNFPVTFTRLGMDLATKLYYLVFKMDCIDGLKKTKMIPITSYLQTYSAYDYIYFATDFGTRQKDTLAEGNINAQIVDDVTDTYTATIKEWDGSNIFTTTEVSVAPPGGVPIPDNTGFAVIELDVTEDVLPTEIIVKLNVSHLYLADLVVNLVSPSGKIINLYNRSLGSSDNFVNTIFTTNQTSPSITSGTQPYTGVWRMALANGVGRSPYISNVTTMKAVLNDYNSFGKWKVVVMDMASSDVGVFNSASIKFNYKYTFQVKDSYRFKVQRNAKNNVRFYWLNKLGGWDSFSFTKNRSKKMSIKRSTFEKYVDYSNYNLFDAGSTQYDTQTVVSGSVYSDFIDETTSEWLSELMSSPFVYRQENSDYVCTSFSELDGLPKPTDDLTTCLERIIIDETSYSYVTKDTVKLVNYNINYTLANQNDVIRF